MDKTVIESIRVEAEGEIANYLESLSTFASVGALTPSVGMERINYVNAPFVANEKNILIETAEHPDTSIYKNKVSIKVTTKNGANTISGTIFDEDVQRIVDINGYIVDIVPNGKMIIFKNSDVPGVIGQVGQILGNNDINIADFRLGRGKNGAVAVILVDNNVSEDVLSELQNLDAAQAVYFVQI
jgi:D-3-phosphoglycerate dehydrogenase